MAANSMSFLPVAGIVTIGAFASGFGVCMFNLETTGECLALANTWVDSFLKFGNQLIIWGLTIVHGAFQR
jgi:hypothetical protein